MPRMRCSDAARLAQKLSIHLALPYLALPWFLRQLFARHYPSVAFRSAKAAHPGSGAEQPQSDSAGDTQTETPLSRSERRHSTAALRAWVEAVGELSEHRSVAFRSAKAARHFRGAKGDNWGPRLAGSFPQGRGDRPDPEQDRPVILSNPLMRAIVGQPKEGDVTPLPSPGGIRASRSD